MKQAKTKFYKNGSYLRAICKICHNKQVTESQSNKDMTAYRRKRYLKNKDKILKECKEYRDSNKEQIKKRKKPYGEYHRNYQRNRRKIDSLYVIKCNIRNSIRDGFKRLNHEKTCNSIEILGCSFEKFKIFIESKWEDWMNWENYGKYNGKENFGWDLDHIIPLSAAKSKEKLIKLNHYSNFRPYCSYKNRVSKRAKYEN